MSNHITATFKTRGALEHALLELEKIGIHQDQISLITQEDSHKTYMNIDEDIDIEESAGEAATSGSLVGAILGGIVTATAVALPGINIVVGGAVAATLIGAGAGALTGAVAGGLMGALGAYGVSEADAKVYEEEIKAGSALLMVKPRSAIEHERIKNLLIREDTSRLAA